MIPVTWISGSLASVASAGAAAVLPLPRFCFQACFLLENSSTSLCCWDAVSPGNVDGDSS